MKITEMKITEMKIRTGLPLCVAVLAVVGGSVPALGQQTELRLDPAKSTVKFSLEAALHTVHGTFQPKPSTLQVDLSSGQVSGAIFVDSKSGVTGNGVRDRKMHKDVLESDRYPDISFHPDRVSGAIARLGKSSVTVHGTFHIYGGDHEITVPALVEMTENSWKAAVHFTIPYAMWGMQNPSNLFLRVSDSVEIDLDAVGTVVDHDSASRHPSQ